MTETLDPEDESVSLVSPAPRSATEGASELSVQYGYTYGVASVIDLAFVHANDERIDVDPFCVLLAFFERGLQLSLRPENIRVLPQAAVAAVFASLDDIANIWYRYTAKNERSLQKVEATRRLRLVLDRAKSMAVVQMRDRQLANRHLLVALLEWFAKPRNREHWPSSAESIFDYGRLMDVLSSHLTQINDLEKLKLWQEVIADIEWTATPSGTGPDNIAVDPGLAGKPLPAIKRGSRLNFGREATHEQIGLDVDRYADSLARLLTSAGPGEFALAIYGHWGRGKTFLIDQLEPLLKKDTVRYAIVRYSAWKYPSTPEAWVHLYESVARAALDRPWWQALPTIFRTALQRRGIGGFAWLFVLLSLAAVTIGNWMMVGSYLLDLVLPVLGIVGSVWVASWLFKVRATGVRLKAEYLTASRHAEKLGLQATIGADLKSLLQGWLPDAKPPSVIELLGVLGPVLAFFGSSTWQLASMASSWRAPALMLAIGLASTGAVAWLRWGGARPKRVLLVVDDLDRCKPDHMLAVVESIKLQLQDPEIAPRVQTLMLVEEDILKQAMLEKYALRFTRAPSTVEATDVNAERIAREVGEKLFTAHLRLPPLASTEALDLLDIFVERRKQEAADSAATSASTIAAVVAVETAPSETEQRAEPTAPFRPDALIRLDPQFEIERQERSAAALATVGLNERSAVLESEERDCLHRALERYASNADLRVTLGPRAIRSLLFRYQLARLLLDQLKINYETSDLADGLVKQCLIRTGTTDEPIAACTRMSDALRWVISQVC